MAVVEFSIQQYQRTGNIQEMEPFMTPMNASTLAGSVLRYGNPVFDCDGAWIRALSRQLANVVTIGGSVSADNLDRVSALVRRFVNDEKPFVLDLTGLDVLTASAARLLDVVSETCEKAGVEWAMVAGGAAAETLGDAGAVFPSVPDALEEFAEVNLSRRSMMMPLLGAKLTKLTKTA